jgi:hypothetical protein
MNNSSNMGSDDCCIVNIHKQLNSELAFMIDITTAHIVAMPYHSISIWQFLSTLTAFMIVHTKDKRYLTEMAEKEGYVLNEVWNPLKDGDAFDRVFKFWESDLVKEFWNGYLKQTVGPMRWDYHDFADDPVDYKDWVTSLLGEYNALIDDGGKHFGSILFYIYISAFYGADSELFKLNPYLSTCTSKNLCTFIEDFMFNTTQVNVYKNYLGMVNVKRQYDYTKKILNKIPDEIILGMSEQESIFIEQCSADKNKINSMLAAASMAEVEMAVEMMSPTPEDPIEIQCREDAIEYLRGLDYISEDEIDGIIDSHFISFGPERALQIIQSTF